MPPHTGDPEFRGTDRFQIERRLGAGAMGIVFEAHDRERGERVALKLLRRLEPSAIFRFKNEFRGLADITHPNLVSLYELITHDDRWFFTMELVDGVDFLSHVRGDPVARGGSGTATDTASVARASRSGPTATGVTPLSVRSSVSSSGSSGVARAVATRPPLAEACQFDRLRGATRQLVAGVDALHRAGHLHRDVKPSNVLVTPEGRVVLLDFGVIGALDQRRAGDDRALVGTPAYMAPEQASGAPLTPASDWYAIGVMLYEALSGRRPFAGDARTILDAKQVAAPPTLRTLEWLPDDLSSVCEELLSRDPEQRLSGAELLERLDGGDRVRSAVALGALAEPTELVGRQHHLTTLRDAYAAVCDDQPRSVFVSGHSGLGKSALCSAFLDQVRATGEAVVLSGRCYEQESVPYKALDSLIDELCQYLLQLPAREVRDMLPRNVQALARLFPVLNRVGAIKEASARAAEAPDVHERRRRGFTVLRRLLTRLADRRPLVLYVDDLQWADSESAELLAEVMRPPDPPVMLLIASFRSEGAEQSAFLKAVRQIPALRPGSGDASLIELTAGALDRAEAIALATELLQGEGVTSADLQARAAAIADESAGNPFFIQELARFSRPAGGRQDDVSLDALMQHRLDDLDDSARRLLEIVAIAGRPVRQRTAVLAAELGAATAAALTLLRNSHLIRTTGARSDDFVETYHDRIRETVVGLVPAERLREHHGALAIALEEHGGDAESIAVHFERAGDITRAAAYCETAARHAAQTLAFGRAAALYRRALDLHPRDSVALRLALADAIAATGRGPEAAEAYLDAAKLADPSTRLACESSAADQLLRSGHIEPALAALDNVLGHVGAKMPKSSARALLSVVWGRVKLKLRGLGWERRPTERIAVQDLLRLDVYQSVAKCLAVVDTIRGADFQSRGLLLALRVGEEARVARAICLEAGYNASQGAHDRAAKLIADGLAIADASGDDNTIALAHTVDGMVSYFKSDLVRAAERVAEGERIFLDRTTGTSWEVNTARLARLWAMRLLGDYAEMRRLFDGYIRDSRGRGDRYVETTMRRLCSELWLLQDDPAGARDNLDKATWMPPDDVFHLQHWYELRAKGEIALYEGDSERALRECSDGLAQLAGSLLVRVQIVRAESRWFHARLLLADAEKASDPRPSLRRVARIARKLHREKLPVASVWGSFLSAAVAARRGKAEAALGHLETAVRIADAVQMNGYVAAARLLAGELIGGDEGLALIAESNAWMKTARIRNRGPMVHMLVPQCKV